MISIIIGGGSLNKDFAGGFIKGFDESSLCIIACDKGYEACLALGLAPDIVVGDFDSISEEVKSALDKESARVIKLNPVKDDTDIEAALNLAIEATAEGDSIYILGGTGGRIDHLLGNISLLGFGCKKERRVKIVDECNSIQMIASGEKLELAKNTQFGKYISVFPYGGTCTGVTLNGFKYPLTDATVEGFNTLTVSNELVESEGFISLENGYLIICESKDN